MKGWLMTISAFLLLALMIAPVTVTAPMPASGTWTDTGASAPDVRMAGGNTIISQTGTTTVTGTFEGTMESNVKVVIHPNGKTNTWVIGVFSGSVDGLSCTLVMRFAATGNAVTGEMEGNWVILSGTGDLANLRGQGTVEGVGGVGGTYSGQILFAP